MSGDLGSYCGPGSCPVAEEPRAQGHPGGQQSSVVPPGGSTGPWSPQPPSAAVGSHIEGVFSKTPHLHSFHLGLGCSLQWILILTLQGTGCDPAIPAFSTQTPTTLIQSRDIPLLSLSSHRSAPTVNSCLL